MNYKIIPTIILFAIAGMYFYSAFFTFAYYPGQLYFDLVVFSTLAIFSLKYVKNRIFQWISVIASLLWAFGGFLGLGWLIAILLGVVYVLMDRSSSSQIPIPVEAPTENPIEQPTENPITN